MASGKSKSRSIKDTPCGNISGPEDFIAAHEEVQNAYDALVNLEGEFQCAAYGQISRRHSGDNKLLQSLNMECVSFLARQKMVTSPEWQSAIARFERAVIALQAATEAMRGQLSAPTTDEVTKVTVTQVQVRTTRRKNL